MLTCNATATATRTGYNFNGWSKSSVSHQFIVVQTQIDRGDTQTYSETVSANWSIKTYSVSYNANGGTGAPSAQVKTYGKTLTLTTKVPTREGYDFVSWNTERDGSGKTYLPGQSYTANAKLTLYAIWELSTYKLTYDANGGDGAPDQGSCLPGDSITVSNIVPIREHYDFHGWAFTRDAAEAALHGGDVYTPSRDVTVYAVWRDHQYQVTLDAGSGTVSPDRISAVYGKPIGQLPKPSYPGCTFGGWLLNGEPVTEDTVFLAGEDVSLTAVWEPNTIHVTFSGNGAAIGNISADYVFGGTFDQMPSPSRWGYDFMGWAPDKEGSRLIHPGATVDLPSDCTLFAIWAPRPSDTVDYGFVWVNKDGRMVLHKVLQKRDGKFIRRKTIIM